MQHSSSQKGQISQRRERSKNTDMTVGDENEMKRKVKCGK